MRGDLKANAKVSLLTSGQAKKCAELCFLNAAFIATASLIEEKFQALQTVFPEDRFLAGLLCIVIPHRSSPPSQDSLQARVYTFEPPLTRHQFPISANP